MASVRPCPEPIGECAPAVSGPVGRPRGRFWWAAALCAGLLAITVAVIATREPSGQRLDERFAEGLAACGRGDLDRVLSAIQALQPHAAYEAHVRLLRASLLFEAERYDDALEQLRPTRAEGDLRPRVLLLVAKCLFFQGHFVEAERILRGLTIEQPEMPESHRWLVPVYREMGAMDLALQELKVVARLEPDDFRTYRLMGLIHKDDRLEYAEAIACYRQALERNPPVDERRTISRELGDALMFLRDYSGALEVLSESEPNSHVLAVQSECHWGLGNREQALEALQRCLDMDPDERSALLLKARIAMDDGEAPAAVPPLQHAVELDPYDWEAHYQLGLAYRKLGDGPRADEAMAKMTASRELRQQLIELVRQARGRPGNAEVREQIAALCRQLGRNRLAEFWDRAARLSRAATDSSGRAGDAVTVPGRMPDPVTDERRWFLPSQTQPEHSRSL